MNRMEDFKGRVDFMCAVIARRGSTTRNFDSCCEMDDGDMVVLAVYRRALNNPKIMANLSRYLCPVSTAELAQQYQNTPTADIPQLAAQMRQGTFDWKEITA